ncbi:MAG: 7-cyano-7-deazaguanine synthase QueC [Acidimicrobiales bacterium]
MHLSLVVLSGGLDSTVCMGEAAAGGGVGVAVSFDYGQRHRVELERAKAVADHYSAEHLVVHLDATAWGGSALTDDTVDVPAPGAPGSDQGGIPITYVPARNLIFLSVAMGVAEARDLDAIYIGVNALDYSGYPDCRPEFIASFAETARLALKRGVEGHPIEVRSPLAELTKADIVRRGLELNAPLHLTWSCYRGGERPCGSCDSCALRAKGFAEAGSEDPALSG